MSCSVHAATLLGVDALSIQVEVDLLRRLPAVVIVGLPSPAIRESAERVRSAILGAGYEFPRQRIVISLSPADLRKDGTAFDLPIAVGILVAAGRVDGERAGRYLLIGELSLSGELRPIRGALAYACLAKEMGAGLILPTACAPEARLVEGLEVRAARSLRAVVDFLSGEGDLPLADGELRRIDRSGPDLRDVQGQPEARLALEVAAAGGHNLLMEGPPGCGKSMLAQRLPGILPALDRLEALECTRIHSAAGLHPPESGLLSARPFRAPHHSVSLAGLIGGSGFRPGEVSLAHNGVLFLDELPEFPRHAREALRAPLEDRRLLLSHVGGHVTFPSRFMLVAAANPCPCGFWGHPIRPCVCTPTLRERYRARLSGPLMDRIDLRIALSPLPAAALLSGPPGEDSAAVRARVERARSIQQHRYQGQITANAELPADQVQAACDPAPGALDLLRQHLDAGNHSARLGRRMLRVARTLADLDGVARVAVPHIRAAISMRADAEEAPCA